MNGSRASSKRSQGKTLERNRTKRWLVAGVLSMQVLFVGAARSAETATIEAVWKPQRVTFVYRGHTTVYSCGGLKRKLETVLLALGAHEKVVFERSECVPGHGARLYVTFKSPIEATEENVRALTTYTSEEQLAARVTGTTLPAAEDLVRFPAVWSQVSFARDRRLRLTPGDCELVESIRRQLLPRLSAHVTTNRVFCAPGTVDIGPPKLVVSALTAADGH